MKFAHVTILLLTFFTTSSVSAQTFGNEWINYDQQYLTFDITQDGFYRIGYNTLNTAGVPASVLPEQFQIFGKEHEIPIYVEDGGDNTMGPGDYILFYAERNDGWLDSLMYEDPNTIGNPAYSLYNDTLTYFLTWNSSGPNERFTVETDVNFGNYPSLASYILYTSEYSISTHYHQGYRTTDASSSFFTPGEGWGEQLRNGLNTAVATEVFSLSTPSPYTGGGAPLAQFTGRSSSGSDATTSGGAPNHHMKWLMGSSNTELMDTTWKGHGQVRCDEAFSASFLTNGTTPVTHEILDDLNVTADQQAVHYFNVKYPRNPDFAGANALEFSVINDPQGKIRLDMANAGTSGSIAVVFGDTPRIIPFAANGGSYSALIPNSTNGVDQTVIVHDTSLITNIDTLIAVNGNGSFTNFPANTASMEEAILMIYHPSMVSSVTEYKDYRANDYSTYMANIEELYLQFGGGIKKHIYGLRRFAHFAYSNTTTKPISLFLLGKGVREASINETTFDGPGTRKNTARYAQSLIPSYGQPSSDIAITAGLTGSSEWQPLFPTGRISANNDQELKDYLDKVKEYELNQDQNSVYDTEHKDWQKHIMHFAGGSNAGEQAQFQSYMNAMETKISDSLFGGYVHRIYKTSSNPLDPTILNEVTTRISEGLSLMSYFGHASGTNSGFEINLDDPANWNNHEKYPVMLVNSCYNGNVFQASTSKSEEFVQVAGFGAIAYIASVGLGVSGSLNQYSQEFYTRISRTQYGGTLGEIMQQTSGTLEQAPNANLNLEATATQMVINGDPMLRLNWHTLPEIEITPEDLSFSPNVLDWTVDSIEVQLNITNLGRSVTDSFVVEITRSFPNSSVDSVYRFFYSELHYSDTLRFKIPLQPNISIGENIFTVNVDVPSYVPEQYEEITNNQITKSLLVNLDGIIPVVPYKFAVVPDSLITVKASTTDPIAPYNTYRFEMDTVDFEGTVPQSGQYRYALISDSGGVVEVLPSQWLSVSTNNNLPLSCEDSVVYFWRVSIDGDSIWRESSFQYIKGKTGWGQDHFFQFKDNSFTNIDYERPTRERLFLPTEKELKCNVNSSNSSADWWDNYYSIDGTIEASGLGVLTTPKLHVAVIDPSTLLPWNAATSPCYGNFNCGQNFNDFHFRQNNAAELAAFQNFVTNVIPDSFYVLIYTPRITKHPTIVSTDSAAVYPTFTSLGSTMFNPNLEQVPYSFFVKKGDPTTVIEGYPAGVQGEGNTFSLTANLVGSDNVGNEGSPLIGPSAQWGNVYWKQDPKEMPTEDTTSLFIIGYDIYGQAQTSVYLEFTPDDSLLNLNSILNATAYPYISLRADYLDTAASTPSQIDRWHVLYQPLPEAAIDGSNGYYWSAGTDPIAEGQDISFAVDVRNIFNIDMDSLLVNYWVENEDHMIIPIAYPRQDSLRVTDLLRDTITFSTQNMAGVNSFWMEINPYVNGSYVVTDQPEQEHFNNLLQIPFTVGTDDVQPILDVTFNGNHILNGDIIDPYGEILITLKDDNPYLVMDEAADTAHFGIYLTDPTGNQQRIPFMDNLGNIVMEWIPATAQNLRFKILWPTAFEMDGTYTLSVQGSDKSGNLSGDLDYRVEFEIIHESTITAMMNYPNPFSTSTRFVFTLTGSEVPDDILIQILTVSGRVVREISEDELGPIQIGRNISEFAWDGTDQFGDPLANGVYLYRVITKIKGEDIKRRDSGADQYFTKDFGKMYLMR